VAVIVVDLATASVAAGAALVTPAAVTMLGIQAFLETLQYDECHDLKSKGTRSCVLVRHSFRLVVWLLRGKCGPSLLMIGNRYRIVLSSGALSNWCGFPTTLRWISLPDAWGKLSVCNHGRVVSEFCPIQRPKFHASSSYYAYVDT
jgi:hypothetical protein